MESLSLECLSLHKDPKVTIVCSVYDGGFNLGQCNLDVHNEHNHVEVLVVGPDFGKGSLSH